MIAIRKFIGGCLENVCYNYANLEAIVGGMGAINDSVRALHSREHDNEAQIR